MSSDVMKPEVSDFVAVAALNRPPVDLMPPKDAYRFERNFTYELSKTEDAPEARRAQPEIRKPVFKGR